MQHEDYRAQQAAGRGDVTEIRRLRAEGMDVVQGFEAGPSPLEAALEAGHADAFWALLEGQGTAVWEDALCLTAYLGSVPTFRRLLELGVTPHAQDEVGENALASAAKGEGDPSGRLEIARLLLAEGVDPTDALDWARRIGEPEMLGLLAGPA